MNTEENDYVIVCGNVQASKEHFKNSKKCTRVHQYQNHGFDFTLLMQHTKR